MWVVMLQKVDNISFHVTTVGLYYSVETAKLAAYHDAGSPLHWKYVEQYTVYYSSPYSSVNYNIQMVLVKEREDVLWENRI